MKMLIKYIILFTFVYSSEISIGGKQYINYNSEWYNGNIENIGSKIIPHRIIIKKTDESLLKNEDLISLGINETDFIINDRSILNKYFILLINNAATDPFQIAEKISKSNTFDYIEFDSYFDYTSFPNDPEYINQWNLDKISMPSAWEITTGSENITVAVIDAGIEYTLDEFSDNIWNNIGEDLNGNGVTMLFENGVWIHDPADINGIDDDQNGYIDDFVGWDFREEDNSPSAVLTHGTYVSSIIGAKTNNNIFISGIAGGWGEIGGSKIMCLNNQTPGELSCNAVNSALAIEYAISNGANIINMSWTIEGQVEYYDYLTEVIQEGYNNNNIIFINSSGNNCGGANLNPHITFPGILDEVISVGSVYQDDIVWHDPYTEAGSCFGEELDIVAPHSVYAVHPSGEGCATSFGGTSAAAPHVSGLAALLLSVDPSLENFMVREIIINTADKVTAMNGVNFVLEYGYGRINVYNSLLNLLNRGDINQDGSINVIDIVLAVNMILGGSYSEYETFMADINQDGIINILDIVALNNIILDT